VPRNAAGGNTRGLRCPWIVAIASRVADRIANITLIVHVKDNRKRPVQAVADVGLCSD
jgi:hypothetical protein